MKAVLKYKSVILIMALLILSLFDAGTLHALKFGHYYINGDSRLWIEGSSTVNNFTCTSANIEGQAILDSVPGFTKIENWKDSSKKYFVNASFNIKTMTLDCGNESMNEDMFEALKADEFAKISFRLQNASLLKIDKRNNKTEVNAEGLLSVAGKVKKINLTVNITELETDTRYRVQCSVDLNMLDFNIEPPSAFFGLIQADEKIKLFLDLNVTNNHFTVK